jgi:hypothetical protein
MAAAQQTIMYEDQLRREQQALGQQVEQQNADQAFQLMKHLDDRNMKQEQLRADLAMKEAAATGKAVKYKEQPLETYTSQVGAAMGNRERSDVRAKQTAQMLLQQLEGAQAMDRTEYTQGETNWRTQHVQDQTNERFGTEMGWKKHEFENLSARDLAHFLNEEKKRANKTANAKIISGGIDAGTSRALAEGDQAAKTLFEMTRVKYLPTDMTETMLMDPETLQKQADLKTYQELMGYDNVYSRNQGAQINAMSAANTGLPATQIPPAGGSVQGTNEARSNLERLHQAIEGFE